jgi:hypothetical protein
MVQEAQKAVEEAEAAADPQPDEGFESAEGEEENEEEEEKEKVEEKVGRTFDPCVRAIVS